MKIGIRIASAVAGLIFGVSVFNLTYAAPVKSKAPQPVVKVHQLDYNTWWDIYLKKVANNG